MAERNAISVLRPEGGADMQWWSIAKEQAAMLVKTGFLPQSIKTTEQCVAIMLKGRELNVPPMYALSNIHVVEGKPTCSAELMLALVHRDCGRDAIRVKHSDNTSCTVQWKEWGGVNEYTFTLKDAEKAGVAGKNTWARYPAAMLRARAISAACRMAFPGSIAGMYTPEELGAAVTVHDDGAVEVIHDARHAAYLNQSEASPTPITTTVQLSQPEEHAAPPSEAKATPLQIAKGKLWDEATRRGMTKEALNDYAEEQVGEGLDNLSLSAVNGLRARLESEPDNDMLLDRLTNRPAAEVIDGPDMFPDVEFAAEEKPDPWTR